MIHELYIATGIWWIPLLEKDSYNAFGGLWKAEVEDDLYVDIAQTLSRILFMCRVGEDAGELLKHNRTFPTNLSDRDFKDQVVAALPGEWCKFLTMCTGPPLEVRPLGVLA